MVLCGLECVNLETSTIRILGLHFSYNRRLENDENYRRYVIRIENFLKLLRMRQLTIHLALVKDVPSSTIAQLEKIQKQFISRNGSTKLKHTTLWNKYEQRGLKPVDMFPKITSLQCSWVEKIYDDSFHARKVITLFLIKNYLVKNFLFYSNLSISQKIIKRFPKFYQEILTR